MGLKIYGSAVSKLNQNFLESTFTEILVSKTFFILQFFMTASQTCTHVGMAPCEIM